MLNNGNLGMQQVASHSVHSQLLTGIQFATLAHQLPKMALSTEEAASFWSILSPSVPDPDPKSPQHPLNLHAVLAPHSVSSELSRSTHSVPLAQVVHWQL